LGEVVASGPGTDDEVPPAPPSSKKPVIHQKTRLGKGPKVGGKKAPINKPLEGEPDEVQAPPSSDKVKTANPECYIQTAMKNKHTGVWESHRYFDPDDPQLEIMERGGWVVSVTDGASRIRCHIRRARAILRKGVID
jgi:hypothetical protein